MIRKIARVRDKATGDYFEIIEFPVSQTEKSRLELPPSVVVDLSAFERRLRDAGAILPKANTRDFLRAAAHRKAPLDFVYEAKTGWTEDRKLFVLNDGVIGKSKQRILGVNQGRTSADASGRQSVAGDWKKWRSTVGKAAGLSYFIRHVRDDQDTDLSRDVAKRFAVLCTAAFGWPYFLMLGTKDPYVIVGAVTFGFAVITALSFSIEAAFFSEMFKTNVRFSGMAIGQQLGAVVSGFTVPLFATYSLALTGGDPWTIGVFCVAMGVAMAFAGFMAQETRGASLASSSGDELREEPEQTTQIR